MVITLLQLLPNIFFLTSNPLPPILGKVVCMNFSCLPYLDFDP